MEIIGLRPGGARETDYNSLSFQANEKRLEQAYPSVFHKDEDDEFWVERDIQHVKSRSGTAIATAVGKLIFEPPGAGGCQPASVCLMIF